MAKDVYFGDKARSRAAQNFQDPLARLGMEALGVRQQALRVVDEQGLVKKEADVLTSSIPKLCIKKIPLLGLCVEPGTQQLAVDAQQPPLTEINTEPVVTETPLPLLEHGVVNRLAKTWTLARLANVVISRNGNPSACNSRKLLACLVE